jgi:hypothetical protein
MDTFYRLELPNRFGYYFMRLSVIRKTFNLYPINEQTHPLPQNDSKLVENLSKVSYDYASGIKNNEKWRFGFSSVAQLRSWFYNNEALALAHAEGVHLAIYKVPRIVRGGAQAIIKGEYHKVENCIKNYSLLDLILNKFILKKCTPIEKPVGEAVS